VNNFVITVRRLILLSAVVESAFLLAIVSGHAGWPFQDRIFADYWCETYYWSDALPDI